MTSSLVTRQRSARDGRSVDLSLTDSGRALIDKAPEAVQDHILEALGRLPSRDRQQLAKLLNRLLQETGIAQGPAKMLMEDDALAEQKV